MEKYVVDTCVAAKIFIDTEKYVDKAVAFYDLARVGWVVKPT